MKPIAHLSMGLKGHFKIFKFREGEEPRLITEFDNLITNGGLERYASGPVRTYVHVGTGTAAEAVTDTALQAFKASSGSDGGFGYSTSSNTTTPPYWGAYTINRVFNPGEATGNITEVGASWTSATGSLYSRALIRDLGGTPVAIPVLADEYLIVQYTTRVYCPVDDVVSIINVDGVDRTVTVRARNFPGGNWNDMNGSANAAWTGSASDGVLGAFTGTPTGTVTPANETTSSYSANSHYLDYTLTLPLANGNFAGGIGTLSFQTNAGDYQVGISPKIIKTADDVLTATLRISWDRYVP